MTVRLQTTETGEARTYGWDTVTAVKVGDMNRAIRDARASPARFTQPVAGADATVTADFGDWQIDNGGDGQLIHFALPLRNVTARYGTGTWTGNATARVEVQMQFLPHSDAANTGDSILHKLVLKTTAAASDPPIAAVVGLDPDTSGTPPDFEFAAVIKRGLQQWLHDNLGQFAHVFATVNLSQVIGGAGAALLAPTSATYMFLALPDLDDSVFAILCRIQQRPADGIAPQLSPSAIPAGARAGFLLSAERMLWLMSKSLPSVLQGVTPKDITLSQDPVQLTVGKHVPLTGEKDQNGKPISATLEAFKVTLAAREMTVESTVSTPIMVGVAAVANTRSFYNIALATTARGAKTLAYEASRDPIVHKYSRTSTGMEIAEIAAAIAGIVIGIATWWTGAGAVLLVASVLLLAGPGVVTLYTYWNKDDSPAIDPFVDAAAGPIAWAQGSEFTLVSAELNDSLQLGGTLDGGTQSL